MNSILLNYFVILLTQFFEKFIIGIISLFIIFSLIKLLKYVKEKYYKEVRICNKYYLERDKFSKTNDYTYIDINFKVIRNILRYSKTIQDFFMISFVHSIKKINIHIPRKNGWQEFEKILDDNKINCLYHFTDLDNLKSIIENGGLYSWESCQKRGIKVLNQSSSTLSRKLDLEKNLHNYVRLSFVIDHPMLFVAVRERRIKNPIIISINREVCYWPKTLYSNINAATKYFKVTIGNTLKHFKNIKFDIFNENYKNLDEHLKKFYQAEVLVHEHVPLNYFISISKWSTSNIRIVE